jgi:hypothetical protein
LEAAPQEAPGQLLTHYAPDLPTFLLTSLGGGSNSGNGVGVASADGVVGVAGGVFGVVGRSRLGSALVLDFGGVLAANQGQPPPWALACYRDLSAAGDPSEAAVHVFEALRWAEGVASKPVAEGAQSERWLLLVDPRLAAAEHQHTEALRDRLFRAASGKEVALEL